jgi:hypothetical protein
MRGVATILVALCGFQCLAGGAALKVSDLSGAVIVVDAQAIPSEKYAAEEFHNLLKEVCGLDLQIASSPGTTARKVLIGPEASGLNVSDLGEEGLRVRISKEGIAIAGGKPRGTLYGVYEFFERAFGVRFLTHDHTWIPKPAASQIPCEEYSFVPPFAFRWPFYAENAAMPDFAARLRVNTTTPDEKLGGNCNQSLINHSLMKYLNPETYGKDHPEYFALVDGARNLDAGGGGPEPCVTNPKVMDIVSEGVLKDIAANPKMKNISVSQNDNADYCRCATCEAVNQREGTPMGSHLAFVNAVADRVGEKFPDVKVGTLAYWYTRKAPKTIAPRKNMQIQLCSIECCTIHPINDPACEKNREFCEDMKNWKAVSDDIWVWNYNTNFSRYDLPFPNLRVIGPNVSFFADNHVKGVFMQANGSGITGEMSDLRNYVIARCLWKPGTDGWAMVEEFCRLHYGNASATILEYLTFLHDNALTTGLHPSCFPTPQEVGLNPEVALKAFSYFQKALGEAENEEVRSRVEKASICAYRAMLDAGGRLEYNPADSQYHIELPPGCENLVERYIELGQRHKMSHTAEHTPASEFYDRIRDKVKGIPAERLENDVWRITLVPREMGKIVELLHKPSGRNLLASVARNNGGLVIGRGVITERGLQGYDEGDPEPFSAEREGSSIKLTKTLADGTIMVRRISLKPESPEQVFCETTITHLGDEPKTYQLRLLPEFEVDTKTGDSTILSAYIKGDSWKQFNQDWDLNTGPQEDLLKSEKGGEVAFFNHPGQFGVRVTYNPEEIEQPKFWWSSERWQANLELFTKSWDLAKGESASFRYSIDYLSAPPK